MRSHLSILVAACVAAALAMACSSESGTETASSPVTACAPYVSAIDLQAPKVSFSSDVLPLLRASCGLSSSCHGGSRAPILAARTDAKAAHENLVGKPSKALPEMAFVTASNLDESFVMHKIDGDQCMYNAKCAGGTCGESMPQGGTLLPVEKRDIIRRWIAQGAKSD